MSALAECRLPLLCLRTAAKSQATPFRCGAAMVNECRVPTTEPRALNVAFVGELSSPNPPDHPLPNSLRRQGQHNVGFTLLNKLDPDWPHLPLQLRPAHPAPHALARISQTVVPPPPLKMPPETVGIERRAVSAPADRLQRVMPAGCFEQIGGDLGASGRPAHGTITATTPAMAKPGRRPARPFPQSPEPARGLHLPAAMRWGR